MAILKVNPTRMELTRLKGKLKTAVRGHKLLKDKRDEMVRQFMILVKENRKLRVDVEKELGIAFNNFLTASLTMSAVDLQEAMMFPAKDYTLTVSKKNIMSVQVPGIEYEEKPMENMFYPYGVLNTSGELDIAVESLSQVLPKLVRLAELEKTCNMLADEIEKTRRRVNALEYVMIPQFEETIRYIKMKLDENDRGNTTRLMKMKASMVG